MKRLFTSESVTEGHPDKLCDYISDSILDSYLAKDKNARVACETVAGKGEIFITGEITSTANVDIEQVVRDTIKEVGYADGEYDIDYRTCKIYINLSKQSPDIALGVDKSLEDKEGKDVESEGAGDQVFRLHPLPHPHGRYQDPEKGGQPRRQAGVRVRRSW